MSQKIEPILDQERRVAIMEPLQAALAPGTPCDDCVAQIRNACAQADGKVIVDCEGFRHLDDRFVRELAAVSRDNEEQHTQKLVLCNVDKSGIAAIRRQRVEEVFVIVETRDQALGQFPVVAD